jgi:hypothetical protein
VVPTDGSLPVAGLPYSNQGTRFHLLTWHVSMLWVIRRTILTVFVVYMQLVSAFQCARCMQNAMWTSIAVVGSESCPSLP